MHPVFRKLAGAAAILAALAAGTGAVAAAQEDTLIEGDGLLTLLNGTSFSADPNAGRNTLLVQSGPDNYLVADQSRAAGGTLLMVHQIGEANLAEVEQFGAGNAASLTQLGNGNEALLTQYGNNNAILQVQQGDGLGIAVTQYGGAQIIITQRNN